MRKYEWQARFIARYLERAASGLVIINHEAIDAALQGSSAAWDENSSDDPADAADAEIEAISG